MRVQITQVISQRTYPGVGDIDDCWVISSIQAIQAVAPWLPLPTATTFRKWAGDPDDGANDGGNNTDIMRAINTHYSQLKVRDMRGVSFDTFLADLKRRQVATVAVKASALPARLQYGFTGLHQVTWFFDNIERTFYQCNPLQPDRSHPDQIFPYEMKAAALGYGGTGVYAVLMPSPEDAFKTHPLYVEPTVTQVPGTYTQEQLDAAVAAAKTTLQGQIDTLTTKLTAEATEDAAVAAILVEQAARLNQ